MYDYKVLDYRVVDGDTVEFTVDLGFDTYRKDHFRMINYDAPEIFRPKTVAEREGGYKVKEQMQKLLDENKDSLYIVSTRKGKYRYLATIYSNKDGVMLNINEQIILFMEQNHLTKEELRKVDNLTGKA